MYHMKNKTQQDIIWDIGGINSALLKYICGCECTGFLYIFLSTKSVLKEQWIRAKYERKEFVDGAPEPPYLKGTHGQIYRCAHISLRIQPSLLTTCH